ncbi:MAG: Lrp/AsnC family transcriptional regulator [Gammaproteobacteria bacterium]|nr:Lrp/AsnC family transcriptional regulator [Gammaproteobacteria bacterium]NIR83506.1 Lrp/AsnC family transcriptional regulator [Gammaproteobacteria bacterium]NIR91428.1 Lrp/AsnC family transcriptional regulator [Gammaproteobacteria bacterium]NIU04668.1 Lrp/AsnC family transcriptional regulator [Gammaproteobacteria bacterium]NIV51710.1 AsnC family transcriptional regulator [Gammaproteobacteria bacterium]
MTDLDGIDRRIINELQGGFPLSDRPWAEVARGIGVTEHELIARVQRLLDEGVLSRFGPMYHAEQLGGALSLCAMQVDREDLERVAAIVNAFTEVAHNYEREHPLNMWFVLATERPERIEEVIEAIEQSTGYRVLNLPKRKEYYVGLKLAI